MAGKCTVDGKDNKEEADMTFSPVFRKSSKVVQSVLDRSKYMFQVFFIVTHLLDHFWTALDTFGKNGLRVMSASCLVLSPLLSLPSTVHLPATM